MLTYVDAVFVYAQFSSLQSPPQMVVISPYLPRYLMYIWCQCMPKSSSHNILWYILMLSFFSCQQCEAVSKFIGECKILSPPEISHFATSLVDNSLPLLRAGPSDNHLQGTVTEMAIHAAAILLCGQNKVLEPLKNLAFSPANMAVRVGHNSISLHRNTP